MKHGVVVAAASESPLEILAEPPPIIPQSGARPKAVVWLFDRRPRPPLPASPKSREPKSKKDLK